MKNPEKMTPEDLVRFLAVEGMGWQGEMRYKASDPSTIFHLMYSEFGEPIFWNPLTVPADRDALVEAMRGKGWSTILGTAHGLSLFYVDMDTIEGKRHKISLYTDTPGQAVCIAAAKALLAQKEANDA